MFTVRSTDEIYNSPMIGNGEIVTTVGPTGYHNGRCPEEESFDRCFFWAGRRLRDAHGVRTRIPRVPPEELIGATFPLVRYGRLSRSLQVDGMETQDEDWTQYVDYNRGMVISTLNHGAIKEQTTSLVCLKSNVAVFQTKLENLSDQQQTLSFRLEFEFGDAYGERASETYIHIRRPHPEDLPFGNVEGIRSDQLDIDRRPPHLLESLKVMYEVQDHLGEVHIGRYPLGKIVSKDYGGEFIHELRLDPGEEEVLWFWVVISDRLTNTHFPDFSRVKALLSDHERDWAEFWDRCQIHLDHPSLEAIYKSSLYTLRCNASYWSNPPGYLSTHWEGRTFHDEFYPFMGLISGNHFELAKRIPDYRLLTLPHAAQRSAGRGAYYGWEVTEDGSESAPYGHWTDERFIHGQFSEQAYQVFLYSRDIEDLRRYYPVLKGCAEWLIYDVLTRDSEGRLKTRLITDINETIYPVYNSIFLACATIRCLDNARKAAQLLSVDAEACSQWDCLAAELRENLPFDEVEGVYRYSDTEDTLPSASHNAMVYPFAFEITSERAWNTLTRTYRAFMERKSERESVEVKFYTGGDNWIWHVSRVATAFFYQGRGNEGYDLLKTVPETVGPFMAPNENFRMEQGPYLPWFTSGAGAYIHAIHAIFARVDEDGTILFPAVPDAFENAEFRWLLGSDMVRISGKLNRRQLVELSLMTDRDMTWKFRIPIEYVKGIDFKVGVVISDPDEYGFASIEVKLEKGITQLV